MNTNLITTHNPEYDKAFWNAMNGNIVSADALRSGKTSMGTIKLPSYTEDKFTEALAKESLFREIGTVLYNQTTSSGQETVMILRHSFLKALQFLSMKEWRISLLMIFTVISLHQSFVWMRILFSVPATILKSI